MRCALQEGITPEGMALGAAACALYAMELDPGSAGSPRELLEKLWGAEAAGAERDGCLSLVQDAVPRLSEWRK